VTPIELDELGPPAELPLTPEQGRSLASSGVVSAAPSPFRSGFYAKGNEAPAHHVVRRSGIEIFCHAVDLDQPPDALLVQMSDLAERIAATRGFSPRLRQHRRDACWS